MTVQYSIEQYSTVHDITVHYRTVQNSTVEYMTVQYITEQYRTVPYSTVQNSTVVSAKQYSQHTEEQSAVNNSRCLPALWEEGACKDAAEPNWEGEIEQLEQEKERENWL